MAMVFPANRADRPTQTENQEIVLDGKSYPVDGPVSVDPTTRFQNKVTFGDYSEDSDPLLSAWITSSLTGGIGNEFLKEGVDDETYWTGTLETRYPGQITLLPYTHTHEGPGAESSMAYPLGDFPSGAPSFWAAFDDDLVQWDHTNSVFVSKGTLSVAPVNKAVEYNDLLWIPLGNAGVATVATNGTIAEDAAIKVRALALWDNKLAALTEDGEIRLKFGDTPWEAVAEDAVLPSGAKPRNLVVFKNQRGDPTLHIITNTDVWAYDRDAATIYRTELQYPTHPDQGLASVNWRGENLYVSVGLGVHSYNGSVVASMGPDSRYGVPAALRGVITGMEPEYNAILALIRGASEAVGDISQEWQINDPAYEQGFRSFVAMKAKSSLLRFSGYGWHPVWESGDSGGDPTWPLVSRADGEYWLWWGFDGKMLRQKLPRTFHNPKQGLKSGVNEFAADGRLITGWFDADMPAFRKLASHMELVLEDALDNGTLTGRASLRYQIDNDPAWHLMGTADRIGRTIFPFRIEPSEGSSGFSRGLSFTRIRFRLELASDDIHLSPVVRSFMLKFIKLPMSVSGRAFTFKIPLTQDRGYKDRGPTEMANELIALTASDRFAELLHGSESYRVRVSQVRLADMTGYDQRGIAEVSCIEIVSPPHDWLPLPGG